MIRPQNRHFQQHWHLKIIQAPDLHSHASVKCTVLIAAGNYSAIHCH